MVFLPLQNKLGYVTWPLLVTNGASERIPILTVVTVASVVSVVFAERPVYRGNGKIYHMPDLVNAVFTLLAAVVCWINVVRLLKDKRVHGVFWPGQILFVCIGIWNLYYYTELSQPFSFVCGLFVVTANILWVALAVAYRKHKY